MLDGLFDWIAAVARRVWGWLTLAGLRRRAHGSGTGKVALVAVATLLLLLVAWWGHFVWHALWIRGYDLAYPQAALTSARTSGPMGNVPEQLAPEGGTRETLSRAPSHLVEVQIALVDFLVEENAWVPALPQYKSGLMWIVPWEATPWLDDKASFQIGVLKAVRRTAVELTDILAASAARRNSTRTCARRGARCNSTRAPGTSTRSTRAAPSAPPRPRPTSSAARSTPTKPTTTA